MLRLLFCVLPAIATQLTVHTKHGAVRGIALNHTGVWRGIRYAAPPVADLRFRPPEEPQDWPGVMDASDFGASCLQRGSKQLGGGEAGWPSINVTLSSEDCLYLNVYAPLKGTAPLPVMVYLHAGEFRMGSSNDLESNWPYFSDGRIVYVTMNSRISLLGYGALDSLRARDPLGSSGNYGLQDQRLGLNWVRENIERFGGDPSRVTIFGESSGGTSVGFHLVSNRSNHLFARAILESPGLTQSKSFAASKANTMYAASMLTAAGSPGCSWNQHSSFEAYPGFFAQSEAPLANASSADSGLVRCAARSDCFLVSQMPGRPVQLHGGGAPGNLSASVVRLYNISAQGTVVPGAQVWIRASAEDTAEPCLMRASAGDIVAANLFPPYGDTFETDAAAPTVDGVELAEDLQSLVRGPAPAAIQVLGGANLDEGTEFMQLCPKLACNATKQDFEAWAVAKFGPELGGKVPGVYADVKDPMPHCVERHYAIADDPGTSQKYWVAAMRSAGDSAILCRARELLRQVHQAGSQNWLYLFSATPVTSINMPNTDTMGAFHGAEIPFVFGDQFELVTDGERILSQAMQCYWTNFATSGNPNQGPSGCVAKLLLPEWPISGLDGNALVFTNSSISTEPGLYSQRCDLFRQYP